MTIDPVSQVKLSLSNTDVSVFTLPQTKNEIPVIESRRLTLRGHRVEDLGACAALWADPQVTRHIGGRPATEEEAWSKLVRYRGLWSLLGYGYWVITDRETGGFIGEAGFADFNRDITPSIADMPEIGWALASSAHGKGLGIEAVGTIVAWGEVHFGQTPTVCIIAPDNLPSLSIAATCGYAEVARTTYKDQPTILFRRQPGTGGPAVTEPKP